VELAGRGAWIGLSKGTVSISGVIQFAMSLNINLTKQDDSVTEETPFQFHYYRHWLVSDGCPKEVAVAIYCDRAARSPVLYADKKVKLHVQLRADISTVPNDSMRKKKGKMAKSTITSTLSSR
jgi:hypothetical protein